ncbi:dihydrolipoamide S-acetyltransferase [Chlorella sorokiniana]|uniref:Dihydrolipoamide acetyltransferase component of pyruvate dehydrogenase complex n=1 Tax=Chlorella sorokiniana TaxID=3076 RepID=A0A2P6U343_CHLSO|nr:dihydrolipoamide S-acetyltransferase [Chlorella sorokiniana]|eukprot:PRW60729.1 dihydrolipoamide S-acetyltransferase [Chlorella sorokiniana]
MPALSPTMSQGNLVAWHVKEGQAVAPGDVLADVETDKATLSWENQDDGFVAKLLVPEGTKDIQVGTPVALLVDEEDQVAAFKSYAPAGGSGGAAAAAAAAEAPSSSGAAAAAAAEAKPVVQRDSRIGPAARTLLEEHGLSPEDVNPTGPHGIITKGDVLAAVEAGVKPRAAAAPAAAAAAAAAAPAAPQQQQVQQQAAAAPQQPAAAAAAPAAATKAPPKGAAYTDIPNSQIRKIIAQRLQESKQSIPHLYISADVELDGVAGLREALKQQGTKVSVNDIVIKAAALALAEVPAANSLWDSTQEAAVSAGSVDIAVAVATEGGLITPIVRGANTKSLAQISAEVRELAGRARANKLQPHEFQGGSFTISNLGMYGVDQFCAIINPPQACIMAVGGSRRVAHMVGGRPASKTQMTVTLSADNRVYDGEVASQFLAAFSRHMANPFTLFQ